MATQTMGDGAPPNVDAMYGAELDDAYNAEPEEDLFSLAEEESVAPEGDSPDPVEASAEPDAPAEPAPEKPDWLPDGLDWSALTTEQKLAFQNVYSRGVQSESSKLTDEERGYLAHIRKAEKTPVADSRDDAPPRFEAPEFAIPDDYKGDAALEAQFKAFSDFGKQASDYINALVNETVEVKRALANIESGSRQTAAEAAWERFVAAHPGADKPEMIQAMNNEMAYLNPSLPLPEQWNRAWKSLNPEEKTTTAVAEQVERGRKIRTASAATPTTPRRNAETTMTTPREPAGGKTFMSVFKAEERAGRLPSQAR